MHPAVDGGELLGGCQPVRPIVLRRDAGVHLLLQARYADLEELVQIGAEDREELEPLEHRVRGVGRLDRKSTRLNSSHGYISYAVFCLKKKKTPLRLLARASSLS